MYATVKNFIQNSIDLIVLEIDFNVHRNLLIW